MAARCICLNAIEQNQLLYQYQSHCFNMTQVQKVVEFEALDPNVQIFTKDDTVACRALGTGTHSALPALLLDNWKRIRKHHSPQQKERKHCVSVFACKQHDLLMEERVVALVSDLQELASFVL